MKGSPRLWLIAFLVSAAGITTVAVSVAASRLTETLSARIEAVSGLKCRIATAYPSLPHGITARKLTIYDRSGQPLLQAERLSLQLHPLRYLLHGRSPAQLLGNLSGSGLTVRLVRDAGGAWNLPRRAQTATAATTGAAPVRTLDFTDLTVNITTDRGSASRSYDKLSAELLPGRKQVRLAVHGKDESLRLAIGTANLQSYTLQANTFSLALLTPLVTSPIPCENLTIDGQAAFNRQLPGSFELALDATIGITSLQHAVLSSRAIDNIALPLKLHGTATSTGFQIRDGALNLAGETAQLRGSVATAGKPVVDLEISFANFSYDRAFSAFPPALHPSLPAIKLSGRMNGTFSLHLDTGHPDNLAYRYNGQADPLRIIDIGPGVIPPASLNGPFVHQVRTATGHGASILLGSNNPDYVPLSAIPSSLVSAVIIAEDGGFFSHKGFSTKHIRDSLIENMKAGRVVRGASTITMQLAKNLYLGPERTVSRKLEEALLTVALEQELGKKRILEIYLNIIEWGNGIYGVGPAARHYFGKAPHELTPAECAFLASIIARPTHNWRTDPLQRLSNGWWEYLRVILCRMYEMGEADLEDLLEAGVPEAKIATLRKGDGSRLARRL